MSENEMRDIFVAGLRNAHAMEKQALSIMKPQGKRTFFRLDDVTRPPRVNPLLSPGSVEEMEGSIKANTSPVPALEIEIGFPNHASLAATWSDACSSAEFPGTLLAADGE